jgi:gliding motility-associated-like protein
LEYITSIACFEENNGSIALDLTGGTSPYEISWANMPGNSEIMTDLYAGDYFVNITDSHNCPAVEKTIVVEELPEIEFHLLPTDLNCYQDQSGDLNVVDLTGGSGSYVSYFWLKDGDQYSIDPDIEQLQAGEYTLTVLDDHGCQATRTQSISEPGELILTLNGEAGVIELGSIDLTVSGGVSPYVYLWNTGAVTEDIDPLGGGTYTVEVTDDHQCKSSESIFVDVHFRILAPTAFSPNGDGINEEFLLKGMGTDLKEFQLSVFNRWGELVFETFDVDDTWNGKYKNYGEPLQKDVYTWYAVISYYGGETVRNNGNVTLLR